MKSMNKILIVTLTAMLILVLGCGRFDSPTASQPSTDSEMGMWNPAPGTRIGAGEVPFLNANYWESLYGPAVNPAQLRTLGVIIGPDGGVVRLGPHMLEVPAGAVSEPVTFSMVYGSTTAVAVDCYPSPYQFAVPVRLTLSFAGTQYQGNDRAAILSVYYMPERGAPEQMPSSVDLQGMRVTAEVNHFSRYILG